MQSTKRFVDTSKADSAAGKYDFLYKPFMRAALPFISGGTAEMVATTAI
jgi:hypothetical protein